MSAEIAWLLREGMHEVRTLCLAPLVRAARTRPRDPMNFYFPRWIERMAQAENDTIDQLRAIGASVSFDDTETKIDYLNVSARTQYGLRRAINNWLAAAHKAEAKTRPIRADNVLTGSAKRTFRRSEQRHQA